MLRLIVICFLLGLPAASHRAQASAVHALVIGIDRYESAGGSLRDLEGAVNDAHDIADVLQAQGARSVTRLINDDAGRDSIFAALDALKARANPGDTLMITYAGHGAREPARNPDQVEDGLDEVMVLGRFRPEYPQNYERIFDYEWRAFVQGATEFNVVLVFDACHSGTLNRAVGQGRTRFAQYGAITQDALPPPTVTETQSAAEPVLEHELYVGATLDTLVVTEIPIDGMPRGALSYHFARAIEGSADLDGDGVITRGELQRYLAVRVREMTEARQFPVIAFAGDGAAPLLPVAAPAETGAPVLRDSSRETAQTLPVAAAPARTDLATCLARAMPSSTPLGLALQSFDTATEAQLYAALARSAQPAAPEDAALRWDRDSGAITSLHGDIVTTLPVGAQDQIAHLRAVVEKWQVLPAFNRLGECLAPLDVSLAPGYGTHCEGAQVEVTISPRKGSYLTMFNIASDGTLQHLYPVARYGDPLQFPPEQPWSMPLEVSAPFGGDHLIALASTTDPSALIAALGAFDGRQAVRPALDALRAEISASNYEIGILPLYTRAGPCP
jgi:hypothetical protein